MLLVPINLIALSHPHPPFYKAESTEHSFLWGGPGYILCVAVATK